ncbi:MAG: UvrD-helicase domain-containing protein [Chloroflexia bacterium]
MLDRLSPEQEELVRAPLDELVGFLSGPAGAGKSTLLAARLIALLRQGVPAYAILVLLPDRAARRRLRQALQGVPLGPYGELSLHTYYSLAQRMVALFWPLVARPAGFAHPERPPVFLTYELAQHHLFRLISPLLEQGYFEGLHLHPQRLVSQLLDNLNKAALNGYPIGEVALRLTGAWNGPPEQRLFFQQAQECIARFRHDCLQRGLLDLSLTLETFQRQLLEQPPFWGYFSERYRHLLVDNLEENVPIAHDFIARLLPHCASALLVYDEGGGYRRLLGADAEGAWRLRRTCTLHRRWEGPAGPPVRLAAVLSARLGQPEAGPTPSPEDAVRPILGVIQTRYRSEMIREVARTLARMVGEEGIPPAEIAVLPPYLDGVLRFALTQECARLGVPLHVLRRYRRPVEEPVVRALLTLAALLRPEWQLPPAPYDVAEALGQVLDGCDPVRAARLTEWVYDPTGPALRDPEGLPAVARLHLSGVSPAASPIERYRAFWQRWQEAGRMDHATRTLPWEHLLAYLLSTFLAGAARDPAVATACAELLESARRFREVFPILYPGEDEDMAGRRYLEMLRRGLVTAQYLVQAPEIPAVLLAPAHTYLLAGRRVRRQFWLDVSSMDWWTPPQQPLTNPYVLSRHWPLGRPWDDAADYASRQAALAQTLRGLCNRCGEGVVLCGSELGTAGQFQDGPLWRALEPIVRLWETGRSV